MKYGLKNYQIEQMQAVFQKYEAVEAVILYGSRARGDYRPYSDLDFTVKGRITFSQLLKLDSELDDLLLPYKMDLSSYEKLDNPDLIQQIAKEGILFYQKGTSPSNHPLDRTAYMK